MNNLISVYDAHFMACNRFHQITFNYHFASIAGIESATRLILEKNRIEAYMDQLSQPFHLANLSLSVHLISHVCFFSLKLQRLTLCVGCFYGDLGEEVQAPRRRETQFFAIG